jgi:two-component system, chemotaxis family, protein-glutamate methylesterase/glutaminase
MKKIRVLVVEDSLTVRKRICELLAADPELLVIAEAENGRQATELCQRHRPDVVTMDIVLSEMSGVAATEHIMAYCPTPILIVSSPDNRGEQFRTLDALAAGAVDVLDKPRGDEEQGVWENRLLRTVKLVSRIKVITHPRGRLNPSKPLPPAPAAPGRRDVLRVVAIGASTGGPAALVEILRSLPRDFPLPILLVIHLGEAFGSAFAEWLDGLSPLRVAYAKDGESLPVGGRVVLAPPSRHLVLTQGRLRLSDAPERHSCRPSVDVLFESLAANVGGGTLACLLTGMGRDGAAGLKAIRDAGGLTIAQDEATSVIFGMPREAIRLDAAERVLPLDGIAALLIAETNGLRGRKTT